MRRLLHDRSGAAALEFAMLLGIFVALILATMQIGMAFKARSEMSHALGEVTRLIYVNPDITPDALKARLAEKLGHYAAADLEVDVHPNVDLRVLWIAVSFPFRLMVPLGPHKTVTLSVEALTPSLPPEG